MPWITDPFTFKQTWTDPPVEERQQRMRLNTLAAGNKLTDSQKKQVSTTQIQKEKEAVDKAKRESKDYTAGRAGSVVNAASGLLDAGSDKGSEVKKAGVKTDDPSGLLEWSGSGSILGTDRLWQETQEYRNLVENMSYGDAQAIRDAAELARSRATTGWEKELQSARIRAAGDRMRSLTGRTKGEGTPWIGPGLRVALDSTGKIQRDDQGRVVYDYDPDAYRGRFYEKYQPTQEEVQHWRTLFPDSPVDITEGYVTPWQQVNVQWMTGSKNEKGKILSDLGITPTDQQIGLFDQQLKEGVVPQAWREAWRTEKWGDVKDPQTGLWTPAPPEQREAAVKKQQERYSKGYFNPTTGKGGAGEGAASQWGVGTGLISPEDFVPEGWTGPKPVPSMGITGTPTGIFAPGEGVASEYLTTPYTRPALQDWSHLMPEEGLLRSQAQRAIVADQGANFQPWAQGGLIEYSPAGTATYVPRTYTPSGSTGTTGTTSAETATNGYTGPLGNQWDSYQDWYMADRPDISGVTTGAGISPLGGHQAAMNRLYNAAGGDATWNKVGLMPGPSAGDFQNYPMKTGYDAWFYGPRGGTTDPMTYVDLALPSTGAVNRGLIPYSDVVAK